MHYYKGGTKNKKSNTSTNHIVGVEEFLEDAPQDARVFMHIPEYNSDADSIDDDDDVEEGFLFIQHVLLTGVMSNGIVMSHYSAEACKDHILLDTGSTVDIFCNPDLLKYIYTTHNKMRISCNVGVVTTQQKVTLHGYGKIWYSPHAITNIISFSNVSKKYRIEWDQSTRTFKVHTKRTIHHFKELPNGLYLLDCTKALIFVETTEDKKEKHSCRTYKQALVARKLQNKMGYPSNATFIKIVESGQLLNCPVTRANIVAAEDILGPNVGALQGKSIERRPQPVNIQMVPLPFDILTRYRELTVLCLINLNTLILSAIQISFYRESSILSRVINCYLMGTVYTNFVLLLI